MTAGAGKCFRCWDGTLAKVDHDQAHREGVGGGHLQRDHVVVEFCGKREKQAL